MSSLLSTDRMQQVFELLGEPLQAVRGSLQAINKPDSAILEETVRHSLSSGGKYLRPALTLLMGGATRSTPDAPAYPQALIESAAVTEMIHVATLLHDDVIDRSDLRRGKKTVRAEWGDKIAVLSGDYLLAQASVKLAALEIPRLVAIFAHVLADLCDGEVEQMRASYGIATASDMESQWDSYYRKTLRKTASLFSAGCESAGVIHQLPEERIQALKSYGKNLGIAFQIMDDLLDYTATESDLGKPVLDDLRNGLMNAPILLALQSSTLTDEERKTLNEAVESLFQNPDPATIQTIQALMERCDAIGETRRLAQKHIDEAKAVLDFLPPSTELEALLVLADYVIERDH
jgi:geranylgeranyl pyrophosphate synthase